MKRTQKSIINVMASVLTNAIILVTAFAVQKVLVATKGPDYNGINGLFGSIITMMSLADLGIGTAIIYHMYQPVADKDTGKINSLLLFYKKCYIGISGVVLLIGAVVGLFLPLLVGDVEIADSIYLIYVLFLADCLCSYFLAYKKSLLYADLMNYVPDTIYFVTYLVQNALQIWVLVAFENFILFLVVKTMGKIVSNLLISLYISKKYPFTKAKEVEPISEEIKQDVQTKVRGLLCHKLGKMLVTGSDSVVITGVLGLGVMNLYTNYHLVIGGITALLNRIFETLTNSVGNFLLDSNQERNRDVYGKIDFLNFWCFGCVATGMYAVLQPLIILWLGEEFLFGKVVVLVLVLNFYLEGMRASVNTFKEAAGIFHEDRKIPLIEAFVNLITSILLAKLMGAAGVFVGTILSTGVVYFYSYPKYVCKPLFGMKYSDYIGQTLKHVVVLCSILAITEGCIVGMEDWNPWVRMIAAGIVAVVVFHAVFLLLYGRSKEFGYYWQLVKQKLLSKEGNKMLELRRKIGKYQEAFYMVFILAMTGMNSAGINSDDRIYLPIFAVATLFLLMKMAVTDFTWQEFLIMAVLTALLGANFLRNGEKTLILTAMGIFGAKNVSLEKVMKYALWVKAALTVVTIGLAAVGVIENVAIILPKNWEAQTIYCYGYYHPNAAFANIFMVLLLAILVYQDKLKWYAYVVGTAIILVAYKMFMCRTGLLVWFVLCLMVMGYKLMKWIKWERLYMKLFLLIPVGLAALTLLISTWARMNANFDAKIDYYLTGRIRHINQFWDNLNISLLGNVPREPFDSIYFHVLYNYGWGLFLLYFIAYVVVMWYCNKKGKYYKTMALSIMAVYGFMEYASLSVLLNMPLLYFAGLLFREKKGTNEQL